MAGLCLTSLCMSQGDYADRNLALWSMATYELLSSTHLLEPVHGVAFNPWDANELICVGTSAITFWLLQHHGADTSFQVPGCWLRCYFILCALVSHLCEGAGSP